MSPFIDDDSYEDDYCLNLQKEKGNLLNNENQELRKKWFSFSINEDKKNFFIGIFTSVIVFVGIIYFMYSNSKPTNIEDLPIIKPVITPIKIKPDFNEQVQHQDKVVYENVSGNNNSKSAKIIVDNHNYISNKQVIQKIDDFSNNSEKLIVNSLNTDDNDLGKIPENNKQQKTLDKKYSKKENVIPDLSTNSLKKKLVINEQYKNTEATNISKKIEKHNVCITNKKRSLPFDKSNIFVQIASLNSKIDADKEYNRVVRKFHKIKSFKKNIVKIDLGKNKGIKYKLKIGPFNTKQDAIFYINLLHESGITSYISK